MYQTTSTFVFKTVPLATGKNCLCVRASSGSSGERKVVTTDLHNLCTSSHTGTSASAPMAAGVIALVLQVSTVS